MMKYFLHTYRDLQNIDLYFYYDRNPFRIFYFYNFQLISSIIINKYYFSSTLNKLIPET